MTLTYQYTVPSIPTLHTFPLLTPLLIRIDTSKTHRTVYTLAGYSREVNIYCSDVNDWDQAVHHRNTEIALRDAYPNSYKKAFAVKQKTGKGTEAAWAEVLNIEGDFFKVLLNTEKTLKIASAIQACD